MDLKKKHLALLFNWIGDCARFGKIRNLAKYFLGPLVEEGKIWQYNLNESTSKAFPGNGFWHSILHAWHKYNFYEPHSGNNVLRDSVV